MSGRRLWAMGRTQRTCVRRVAYGPSVGRAHGRAFFCQSILGEARGAGPRLWAPVEFGGPGRPVWHCPGVCAVPGDIPRKASSHSLWYELGRYPLNNASRRQGCAADRQVTYFMVPARGRTRWEARGTAMQGRVGLERRRRPSVSAVRPL